MVSNATRQAFVRIVDLCVDEGIDALILAGDLYDGDQTSMKTAQFFAGQMARLDSAGIRVFILRGNHDALSRITKELVLPESVVVFGGRAEAMALDRKGALPDIVVHGLSFANPKAPESLLSKYKTPVSGAVNIGVMHTSLGGAVGHDPYAPCSVQDLEGSGFQYWALGHIHKRSAWVDTCTTVMPGNPQGRDINEAGPKSVSLVTVQDNGDITVEERNVSIAQFERLLVDVSGVDDWRDLVTTASTALRALRREVLTEHLIVRLRLTGKTPLSWRMRRDADLLQTEMNAQGEQVGNTWIEKVEIATETGSAENGRAETGALAEAASGNTIVELRALIDMKLRSSPGFQAQMHEIAEDLLKSLPVEIRGQFGGDELEQSAFLDNLLCQGADDVLARLQDNQASGAG
ncbi:hypothetical protein ABAC402_06970 [Asticcacaulis sp. AC402]|nr:hypothetical protein ABAC402_06970 [Asticcacaulis sp. AC402]